MTRDTRLYLAWLVALVATLGSLYLSEVRGFLPCVLCWYQRIAMYPLALLLGVAAFFGDHSIRRYVLPLALTGFGIALFQNLEMWGVVRNIKPCTVGVPCSTLWPVWGENAALNKALSVPVLSMIAFGLILALLAWPRRQTASDATLQRSA